MALLGWRWILYLWLRDFSTSELYSNNELNPNTTPFIPRFSLYSNSKSKISSSKLCYYDGMLGSYCWVPNVYPCNPFDPFDLRSTPNMIMNNNKIYLTPIVWTSELSNYYAYTVESQNSRECLAHSFIPTYKNVFLQSCKNEHTVNSNINRLNPNASPFFPSTHGCFKLLIAAFKRSEEVWDEFTL